MRLAGLAAMLLLGTSALEARPMKRADPRDLHHCRLQAVHPADNDIHPDDDRSVKSRPAQLPAAVAHRILDYVSDQAKKQFTLTEWSDAQQRCADIFSRVYRLTGPDELQLFVAQRYFPHGNSVDYFFMHDPLTGAVTKEPPLIFTKWWSMFGVKDPLMTRPIVRMEPAARGQPARLIVEERTHNGNVYNAAVYRYFDVGKNMSLTQVLANEARAYFFSDGLTERKATFLKPNRVHMVVTTRPPRHFDVHGTVLLERAHPGQPFHVVQRKPAGDRGLLTYCEEAKSDDDFLRVGCDFYY